MRTESMWSDCCTLWGSIADRTDSLDTTTLCSAAATASRGDTVAVSPTRTSTPSTASGAKSAAWNLSE